MVADSTPPVVGDIEILALLVVVGFVALCVLSMANAVIAKRAQRQAELGRAVLIVCYVWAWLAFILGLVVLST